MKQTLILYLISLIFFSCKGQEIDKVEILKSSEHNTLEILPTKNNSDSLRVKISIPKKNILLINKENIPVNIEYHKDILNLDISGRIHFNDDLNFNDTIKYDIIYFTFIHKKTLENLINNVELEEKINFKISNNHQLYKVLKNYKKDEILFKYRYVDDLEELHVLSIPVNLE